jgi:8-oxo-dGTP pyrophosphatase MutT (NUDIX family)
MAEIPRAGASAVAIIETPDSFIAEGRPDIPGQLANSGRVGLFGGHIEPEQTAYDAVRAELDQELGFRPIGPLQLLEEGDVESQNKHGEKAMRHVSLFRVAIDSVAELNMQLPATIIVQIPRTVEGIESYRDRVTPYTFRVLLRAVTERTS